MNIHNKINQKVINLVVDDMHSRFDDWLPKSANPLNWPLHDIFTYYNKNEHLWMKD